VHEFQRLLSDRWNEHSDDCYGECVLRRPELAAEVASSLRHFLDGAAKSATANSETRRRASAPLAPAGRGCRAG
jgi:hypothetical protein